MFRFKMLGEQKKKMGQAKKWSFNGLIPFNSKSLVRKLSIPQILKIK